jgi:hypothetical protein
MSGVEILLLPLIAVLFAFPPALESLTHGIERAHQKYKSHQQTQKEKRLLNPNAASPRGDFFSMDLATLWWKEVTTPRAKRRKLVKGSSRGGQEAAVRQPLLVPETEHRSMESDAGAGAGAVAAEAKTSLIAVPRARTLGLIFVVFGLWTYVSFVFVTKVLYRAMVGYCLVTHEVAVPASRLWPWLGFGRALEVVEAKVEWRGGVFCWIVSCFARK